MAYEKKAAAGSTPALINFYYKTDDIFSSVSLRSMFRAKNLLDKEGNSQLDQVGISPDEKTFVVEALKQVVLDIGGAMFKIADPSSESPVIINADYTPSGGSSAKYSVIKIKDNTAYNASILQIIDAKIENCIRYFILFQWYIVCGLADDVQINSTQYQGYLREMKNLTFELRKPVMT